MFRQLNHSGGWVLGSALLLATPVLAHTVEISGTVGGTIHIEPNDTPQAGQPSQVWFALTRRGGDSIPLSACSCQLALYAQPVQSDSQPLARPILRSVSAEGRRGIPGAEVTFPRAGSYELVLRGRPIQAGQFSEFELRFPVTVAR
jgi:hypothetical protein